MMERRPDHHVIDAEPGLQRHSREEKKRPASLADPILSSIDVPHRRSIILGGRLQVCLSSLSYCVQTPYLSFGDRGDLGDPTRLCAPASAPKGQPRV